MRLHFISLLLVALVTVSAVYASINRIGGSFADLDAVHAWVAGQFPDVAHIQPDELAGLDGHGGDGADIIVFDVREPEEFAVSHIAGALQVSPGMGREEFIRRFGKQIEGKTAIFYCSVGYRSSQLANRVDTAIRGQGAKASYNLAGGLFNWHNQKKPLVSLANRATQEIHPYNQEWGRHVADKAMVSFTPAAGE